MELGLGVTLETGEAGEVGRRGTARGLAAATVSPCCFRRSVDAERGREWRALLRPQSVLTEEESGPSLPPLSAPSSSSLTTAVESPESLKALPAPAPPQPPPLPLPLLSTSGWVQFPNNASPLPESAKASMALTLLSTRFASLPVSCSLPVCPSRPAR